MGQLEGVRRVAGRYRLIEVLGRGGMGTVWRAEDELLGRAVAVKVVAAPDDVSGSGAPEPADPEPRAQTADRARREARAAARLNHPGAVTVHDVVAEDGRFHIVMELIDAPTLAQLVRAEGHLSPARVAGIGAQLLDVLEFAHAAGIVHRDVKPSNVMVLAGDRVKLTDFGIAVLRGDPQLTASGTTLGSPMFMAPEQAAGTSVGPAADLWSLGATMYYAVEGRAPFDRPTAMAVLAALLSQPPDPPRLAGRLEPALTALLARSPESRPDGVPLRRLLSLAAGSDTVAGERSASPDAQPAVPEIDATMDAPAPADTLTADPAGPGEPAEPGTPSYGTPEPADERELSVQDSDPPIAGRPGAAPSRTRRRRGKTVAGLVGVLTVAVATVSFVLNRDRDPDDPSGPGVTSVQQDDGAAGDANPGRTGAAVAPAAAAPLAPDTPAAGLGLGSAGISGLRQVEPSDAGPPGQSLARFFGSVANPVGGYAVGAPQAFEVVTAGPTTFVELGDTMFRSGFEVRSYHAVDPWARLVQDEKQFAREHAGDGYRRTQLTRRWTYRGQAASAWEFTWTLNGETMHAREVAFRVGSRTYTVLYRSADLWWLGGGSAAWPVGFEQSFFPLP